MAYVRVWIHAVWGTKDRYPYLNKEVKTLPRHDEYYASSVSESAIEKVRAYISSQEEHHKKTTFKQEYDEFMAEYKSQG